ncbi:hypothetical protein [Tolypothrix sp. VBCCA 56010]|uniref:hypothetical protein n=1 Tax=Tolypothrix sp. VBCCA 56010 TaxID=3137731 RepID=UPI003D7CCCE9
MGNGNKKKLDVFHLPTWIMPDAHLDDAPCPMPHSPMPHSPFPLVHTFFPPNSDIN